MKTWKTKKFYTDLKINSIANFMVNNPDILIVSIRIEGKNLFLTYQTEVLELP